MRKRHSYVALMVLLIAAFSLASCGPAASAPQATEPADGGEPAATQQPTDQPAPELAQVTLRLPWIINAQFAGPFMALDQGYFEDEGLEVTIRPGGFDINSITLVASGEDTFGLHDMGSLILARSNDVDVVAAATFFQKHPGGLLALAESGIESLEDIEGRTIGFQEGGPWMLSQAMLSANGLDLDNVDKVAVGFDLSPLYSSRIDLLTVYVTNEPLIAEAEGYETRVFLPYDYGIETSSEALFTTDSYLQQNPEQACGMVRAIQRGWQYAIDNPDESIDVIMAAGGDELSREAEMAQLMAEMDNLMTEETEEHGLGYMTEARWQTAEDVLAEYGQLETDVNIHDVFTMQCFGE